MLKNGKNIQHLALLENKLKVLEGNLNMEDNIQSYNYIYIK